MLFFDFKSQNGKPVNITFQDPFFESLKDELGICEYGTGFIFHKEIGVPAGAFMINDEAYTNSPEIIQFVVSEYAKKKLKGLNNQSLSDLKIDILFCKHISNSELDRTFNIALGDDQIFCEETLWREMTEDEKTAKMQKFFNTIGTNGNELIIIDPYLAPKNESYEYFSFLTNILNSSNASNIIIYTNTAKNDLDRIKGDLNMPLRVINTTHFHDRFWIANNEKGFLTGTSLNGIGKRFSLIQTLDAEDVEAILNEVSSLPS